MAEQNLAHEDVVAALAARRALGPDYDDVIAESLVERVEAAVAARTEALGRAAKEVKQSQDRALGLALGSLGIGVPLTAIAGGITGLPGMIAAWTGIAVVNVAYNLGNRRR